MEGIGVVARIQYRVNYAADDLKRKQCLLEDLMYHVQQSSLIDNCLCSHHPTSFFVIYFEIGEGDIL